MIKTLLIGPDLTVKQSIDKYAYQAFSEIRNMQRTQDEPINIELPDNTWVHTIPTTEGLYMTIHKECIEDEEISFTTLITKLQNDYEAIREFSGDWSEQLRDKYKLTHAQIVTLIEL